MSKGYCGQCGEPYSDEIKCECQRRTPGPWFLVNEDGTDCEIIADEKGKEVLGVSEWIRADVPDLRLMAAAPELLEALEHVVENYDIQCDLVYDAIAKAKREQE